MPKMRQNNQTQGQDNVVEADQGRDAVDTFEVREIDSTRTCVSGQLHRTSHSWAQRLQRLAYEATCFKNFEQVKSLA